LLLSRRYKNQREREREINSEKKKIRDEMARAERLKVMRGDSGAAAGDADNHSEK
jgi:hypothetical protein